VENSLPVILRYLGAGGVVVKLVLDENECMGQLDAGDETNGEYTLEGST
jgi:hypothetical protein